MARALKAVESKANKQISDIDPEMHKEATFLFGGVITSMRTVTAKKTGKPMAFGTIEDSSGSTQFVAFPKTFEEYGHLLKVDAVLLVRAKVDYRDEEIQLIVEKLVVPTDVESSPAGVEADHELFIPRNTTQTTLQALGKLLKQNPGAESVVVVIPNGGKPQRMVLPYTVDWTAILEKQIVDLLG
jgi:DNA polymerase-3 subunit alpha